MERTERSKNSNNTPEIFIECQKCKREFNSHIFLWIVSEDNKKMCYECGLPIAKQQHDNLLIDIFKNQCLPKIPLVFHDIANDEFNNELKRLDKLNMCYTYDEVEHLGIIRWNAWNRIEDFIWIDCSRYKEMQMRRGRVSEIRNSYEKSYDEYEKLYIEQHEDVLYQEIHILIAYIRYYLEGCYIEAWFIYSKLNNEATVNEIRAARTLIGNWVDPKFEKYYKSM